MILESIQLHHVGRFTDPVAVGPFSRGLNVLASENESGKTTLVKAATRALFDKHTCKDQEIKALQPAGTELAPKITVIFQVAAAKLKIEKTFLLSPKCLLSEWRGNGWQLVAEGDEADKRIVALLKSTQPGRGASSEAHWGLMRYLWARQGEPTAWPKWEDEAGQIIQNRLAKVELDPLIDRLGTKLWSDYLESFTVTGQVKANSPLKKGEDELEQIDGELCDIERRRRQSETLQTDFQNLSSQVAQLKTESVQKQKEAAEIRESAHLAELLSVELKAKEEAFENARAALRTIDEDCQLVDKLKAELGETERRLETVQAEVNACGSSEALLIQKQAESDSALEAHQVELATIRLEFERVQKLIKHRNDKNNFERLESLSKKVSSQTTRQNDFQEQFSRLPEITPAKFKKLENSQQSIRDMKVQLEAVGLSVELVPDKDSKVQISESGQKSSVALKAKEQKTFKAAQSLELSLTGWGKVVIRSGADEIKNLVVDLEKKEAAFKETLLEIGVDSVEQARTTLDRRRQLDQQIETAKATMEELLADWESPEEFLQELNTQRIRLTALEATLGLDDAEKRQSLSEIEAVEQKLTAQVEQMERAGKIFSKAAKLAGAELSEAREMRQVYEKDASSVTSKIHGIKQQIQTILARYTPDIEKAKKKAGHTFVEAEAHLNVTKGKLPADYDKLPERNKRAAKAAEEIAGELKDKTARANQMEGRLGEMGSEGLYSKETALLERRDIASHTADADRARGWATRLVHDLIENRKQEATRSVLAPLEARLSSAFAEITGNHHRQVFLDESLQIRGVGRNQNELIEFASLSQGAREQLLLALRLAVATELATDEPQLLILDDVLVNTDPTRQGRVLDLLRNAEEKLQILILTCHPERYRGVGTQIQCNRMEVSGL